MIRLTPLQTDITTLTEDAIVNAANLSRLGTAHVKAGELIAGRLLTPVEIAQIAVQGHSKSL